MSVSARPRTERGPTASISVESSMLARRLLNWTVGPDTRVVGVPRADLLEGGRGDVAAEVARLRRVDHDHDLDLGILGRQEADERGVVLVRVAAVLRLLGAATSPPKWLVCGESTTIMISTWGSSAGRKPTNEASYWFE